jgi:hypothetical protein
VGAPKEEEAPYGIDPKAPLSGKAAAAAVVVVVVDEGRGVSSCH